MATPHKCPVCNGTGKVYPEYLATSMAKVDCSACGGTCVVWEPGQDLKADLGNSAVPGEPSLPLRG